MSLRTFHFIGFSLPKASFDEDQTLLTKQFWFALLDKFINETTDTNAKKYATMAKGYIVYSSFASDYNPVAEKAYVYYEFMSDRHVSQFKTLIAPVLLWANQKYGMKISDQKSVTIEDDETKTNVFWSIRYAFMEGFSKHIPQQLGYIS